MDRSDLPPLPRSSETVGGMARAEFEGFIGHPLQDWQWKVLHQLAGDPEPQATERIERKPRLPGIDYPPENPGF